MSFRQNETLTKELGRGGEGRFGLREPVVTGHLSGDYNGLRVNIFIDRRGI